MDDCIIAVEMLDILFIYLNLQKNLQRFYMLVIKNYPERLLCLLVHLKFLYKFQNTTKVIIQCIPVDEEMEEEVFLDMKVIDFKYKKIH